MTTFQTIHSYSQALQFLNTSMPRAPREKFTGDWGLQRTKYLLQLLDNPQEKLKVVHIAGTSGKGSTAYLISTILGGLGLKVGLSVSPHVIDIRERLQVNNTFITEDEFCDYLNEIFPAIEKVKQSEYGSPTYFELIIALAFYIFWKKKLDYAVIETGLGGLFDATNTVMNPDKVCVLTSIGFDHMHVLGNTLKEIAYQKAKIIHPGNVVISAPQQAESKQVIETIVAEEKADLIQVTDSDYTNIKSAEGNIIFDFKYKETIIPSLLVALNGSYQAENVTVALTTVLRMGKRDKFKIDQAALRKALSSLKIPGRMEIKKIKNKTVIFDGAHNPEKMEAFIHSLHGLFPQQKFNFLLAFAQKKDFPNILPLIIPYAEKIIITKFFNDGVDFVHVSEEPEDIARELDKLGFQDYFICKDPQEAFQKLLHTKKDRLVVTGSFYLISSLYNTEITKLN